MSVRESPGVLANGGGSLMTGVFSLSGCVRSTTRTAPDARAARTSSRGLVDVAMAEPYPPPTAVAPPASVAAEGLLEPLGDDVGVDLRVDHQRAVALLRPLAHRGQVGRAARGHADAARGDGERGEVGVGELSE